MSYTRHFIVCANAEYMRKKALLEIKNAFAGRAAPEKASEVSDAPVNSEVG
jgi:hypothetical protein